MVSTTGGSLILRFNTGTGHRFRWSDPGRLLSPGGIDEANLRHRGEGSRALLDRYPHTDVLLLLAHPRQGLVLSADVARVDRGVPPAMGRPACAVIPQVVNDGKAAMSLGGGARLDHYCELIETLAMANTTLTAFHERRRRDVGSGERPTAQQSLARLSE